MGKLRNFVPTKKISAGGMVFRKWEDWKESDFVIGEFHSFRMDQFEKENLVLRVLEASWDKSLEGKLISMNHCGSLGTSYDTIREMGGNPVVQVTYTGKIKLTTGKFKGKEAHTVDVSIMEEEEGAL